MKKKCKGDNCERADLLAVYFPCFALCAIFSFYVFPFRSNCSKLMTNDIVS